MFFKQIIRWVTIVGITVLGMGHSIMKGVPQANLATDPLTKTVIYDGGYIPDLERAGNMLAVPTIDSLQVFDLSQQPAVQIKNIPTSDTSVVAFDASAQWIAFDTPGVSGDSIYVMPLAALSLEPSDGYAAQGDFGKVNDLLMDNNLVVYAASDNGKLWFIEGAENISGVEAHAGGVNTLSLSPAGTLASGGNDGNVKIWSGQRLSQTIAISQPVKQIVWSPSGSNAIAIRLEDGAVQLWEAGTLLDFPAHATNLTYSPNGTQLALGQASGLIEIWNISDQTKIATLDGHAQAITALSWRSDGLTSAAFDGKVQIWNNQFALQSTLDVIPCCLRNLTSNGTLFLFQQESVIWEWNNLTQALRPVFLDEIAVYHMLLSSSGQYLVIDEAVNSAKSYPVLYERTASGDYTRLSAYTALLDSNEFQRMVAMKFNPSENRLVTLFIRGESGYLMEFSVPDLTLITETPFSFQPSGGLAIAPDNSVAFMADEDALMLEQGEGFQFFYHNLSSGYDMEYSPSGQQIAIGTNFYADLINLATPTEEKQVCISQSRDGSDTDRPTYLEFSLISPYLVCANTELIFWDTAQNVQLQSYLLHNAGDSLATTHGLALSANEEQVFVLYGNQFQVWQSGQ